MTAEEDALLRTLEARVTQVTLEYKALKDRYAALSRTMEEKMPPSPRYIRKSTACKQIMPT